FSIWPPEAGLLTWIAVPMLLETGSRALHASIFGAGAWYAAPGPISRTGPFWWLPRFTTGGWMRNLVILSLTFGIICLTPLVGFSQGLGRNPELEKAIWQELQAIAPDQLETFKAATEAMDDGDAMRAVQLFRAVYKRAPNWDVVMRRLGGELVE